MAGGHTIAITFFADYAAATKREQLLDLMDLAERIRITTAATKGQLPWLKLGRFGENRTERRSLRWDANLIAITGIEADYDAEEIRFEEAVEVLGAFGLFCLIYTSPSHTPERPRWRILCPLAAEAPPEERDHYLARLNGLFGGVFANESWTRSQSYYYGSINHNPAHQVTTLDGIPIDLADELDAGAIGKPKPANLKPNGQDHGPLFHGPATSPEQITDKRLAGVVESLLQNLRTAPDGTKHHTLIANGRTLGGYLHILGWSDEQAVEVLIGALPMSVKNWAQARQTAGWAIASGRQHPLELEDRPGYAPGYVPVYRGQDGFFSGGNWQVNPPELSGLSGQPPGESGESGVSPGHEGETPQAPRSDGPSPEVSREASEARQPGERVEEKPPEAWNVDEMPDGEEPPPGEPGDRGRPGEPPQMPVIYCVAGELPRMVRQAQAALLNGKASLYQRGMLVQPTEQQYTAADGSETHSAALVPVTAPALLVLLSGVAIWMKPNARAKGFVPCDPPDKLVQAVLHNRTGWPFPHVRGVLTCPTLRPDGSLLATPGYDEVSRYFLMFPEGLELPEIPEAPTKAEAKAAFRRLDELLDSYPWVSRASRAVGHCMLMTQVVRCAMPVSPLLAVSARAPGTGKSHLVDLASTVAIGRPCPAMGTTKKDEETEKGINTMLIAGVPGFSVDNVSRDLDTPTLNMATERPLITIRLFGVLEHVEVENAVVIYMTGNNLAIIDEQGRRTVRAELDAQVERPERRDFQGDPIHTVRANRGRYIADVLTIARAYHLSGEHVAPFALGSYGAWSHFVREPLVWLGQADPAETMEETAKDDPANLRLRAILAGWYFDFSLQSKTLADAVHQASPEFRDTLKEQFPSRGGADVDTTKMGNWLRKVTGRIADGMRFAKEDGQTGHTNRWYISLI